MRPSAIETFQRCPLRWVLSAVGAEASPDTTRTVGTAVHAVAQQVAEGLPPAEAPAAARPPSSTSSTSVRGWSDQRQRQSAQDMLDRVPRLARRRRPGAGRRRGRVRRHRRPGAVIRGTGRPAGAGRRGPAGRRRPQDRQDARPRTPRSTASWPPTRWPSPRALRASTARRPAARRCCRSARAPRPRSSTRSRCPPTCPSRRPGPASCSPRSATGMGGGAVRGAHRHRTASAARRGAAARCRSPAGR